MRDKIKLILIFPLLLVLIFNCKNIPEKKNTKDMYLKIFILEDSILRYTLEINNDSISTEINYCIVDVFPLELDYGTKFENIPYNQHPISKIKNQKILIDGQKKLISNGYRILKKEKIKLDDKNADIIFKTVKKIESIKNTKVKLDYRIEDLSDLACINKCCDFKYFSIIVTKNKLMVFTFAEIYMYSSEFQEINNNLYKIYNMSPIEIIFFDKKREMEQLSLDKKQTK